MSRVRSGWVLDIVVGGGVGVLVAAVVTLNLMIYLGPESGYQTSLVELFAHSLPAGLLVTAVLVTGPVLGVLLARRWRRNRQDVRERDSDSEST